MYRLLLLLSCCAVALVASPVKGETVELQVQTTGLEKALAEKLEEELEGVAALYLGTLLTEPDEGEEGDCRIKIQFDGSASGSAPASVTRTGELLVNGIPTGKPGFELHCITRLTLRGRIAFTVQRRERGAYKLVDQWAQSLGARSEEKSLGTTPASVLSKKLLAEWNRKVAGGHFQVEAVQQLSDWLVEQVVSTAEASLRDRWVTVRLQRVHRVGDVLKGTVTVTNRSPWPIEQVTFEVVAVPGPVKVLVEYPLGTGEATAKVAPGKTVTVDFESDATQAFAELPVAVTVNRGTVRLLIETVIW